MERGGGGSADYPSIQSGLALLEVVCVLGDVALHLLRDLVLRVDGLDRALGLAGPAVYALLGVDQELVPPVVDAVHRTHLDAALVLRADTRLGNNVGQFALPPLGTRVPRRGFIPTKNGPNTRR